MKIFVFGGTTEGRLLAELLPGAGHEVTVSVATDIGLEELAGAACRKLAGRLDAEEMRAAIRNSDLVIDATHPYAVEASRNILLACNKENIPLKRVVREAADMSPGFRYFPARTPDGRSSTIDPDYGHQIGGAGLIRVDSCPEAAAYLKDRPGNVLITTGSRELSAYRSLDPVRLFPRVLPSHEALNACEDLGIPHRNILALQGPFSEEMNRAILLQYRIRFMITKDGGTPGGFMEKIRAAESLGVGVILVRRPGDAVTEHNGISMEELLKESGLYCCCE